MAHKAFVLTVIYQFVIGLGVVLAALFLWVSYKSNAKLPEGWRKSETHRLFQRSVLFLLSYLAINLICESIAIHLARHRIYNSYVMSINMTLSTLFLFGFLFINTRLVWKHYSYFILFICLVIYFIAGGYYHPKCILTITSSLVFHGICFLGLSIYLTELLLRPDYPHFRFQLQITASSLIYFLLSEIICSFSWYDMLYSETIFYLQISNALLFYLSLILIFCIKLVKLHRL